MAIFENQIIYFIQGEITQLIKIGRTKRIVEDRKLDLETGSPDKLNILGLTFEPFFNESELHTKFSNSRKHGEWFYPSEEIKGNSRHPPFEIKKG